MRRAQPESRSEAGPGVPRARALNIYYIYNIYLTIATT